MLPGAAEQAFREFFSAISVAPRPPHVAWALDRFEMGCGRATDAEGLTDYLLGLRALLDAGTDAGQASFGLRLAALCAEEGSRGELQERMEAAAGLERYVMGHTSGASVDAESPRELVAEVEGHLRALLRDVLCGYLDADLKSVADDILLEAPEGMDIKARDTRSEPATDEIDSVQPELQPEPEPDPEPEPEPEPEGVTPSA